MDPYDEYMKQQEDWQSEISKRDDEITRLSEALQFYSDKSNLEKYIATKEHYTPSDMGGPMEWSWTEVYMYEGITKVAETALNDKGRITDDR